LVRYVHRNVATDFSFNLLLLLVIVSHRSAVIKFIILSCDTGESCGRL
jgi:hypothetical protein